MLLMFLGYWMWIHFNFRNSKGENITLKDSFQLTALLFLFMIQSVWDYLKSIFTGSKPRGYYGVIFR